MTNHDVDAIAAALETVTQPLHARISKLEQQLAEVRSKAAAPNADLAHRLGQIEAALGIRS